MCSFVSFFKKKMLLLPQSTDDLRARGAGTGGRAVVSYTRTERARVLLVIFLYVLSCGVSASLPTPLALAFSLVASGLYVPVLVEIELYTRNHDCE